jgi:hypothetical protein
MANNTKKLILLDAMQKSLKNRRVTPRTCVFGGKAVMVAFDFNTVRDAGIFLNIIRDIKDLK